MDQGIRSVAKSSLLLSNMPDDTADLLLSQAKPRHYDQGETIFLQGAPAEAIYIVIDGWVKLYRIAPNGAEAVVGVFTRGRSFGEALALRHELYPVAAESVTDSHVLCLPCSALTSLIREDPEICISLLASSFQHLHSLVVQLEQLKAQSGAQRIAGFLLGLCPVAEGACTVTLPYDKVLIAGRLGMQPESLSRSFSRLREVGVSVRQNQAAIADVERLRDYADGEEGPRERQFK